VGAPSWIRISLGSGELELVVEDAHDRLREVEAALMWLQQTELRAAFGRGVRRRGSSREAGA
jgi:hypothetical protein